MGLPWPINNAGILFIGETSFIISIKRYFFELALIIIPLYNENKNGFLTDLV